MAENVDPFADLQRLHHFLETCSAISARYMDARAAYREHNDPVDLLLARHHAERFIEGALLISRLAGSLELELRRSHLDPEVARIGLNVLDAVQTCRVATGQLNLDLQRLTDGAFGAADLECAAMVSEAQAAYPEDNGGVADART
ncbi:MAG: hypothetical protein ACYCSN_19390 [Acidobacteriaceae bacterium]